jgi:hypothetical protein
MIVSPSRVLQVPSTQLNASTLADIRLPEASCNAGAKTICQRRPSSSFPGHVTSCAGPFAATRMAGHARVVLHRSPCRETNQHLRVAATGPGRRKFVLRAALHRPWSELLRGELFMKAAIRSPRNEPRPGRTSRPGRGMVAVSWYSNQPSGPGCSRPERPDVESE